MQWDDIPCCNRCTTNWTQITTRAWDGIDHHDDLDRHGRSTSTCNWTRTQKSAWVCKWVINSFTVVHLIAQNYDLVNYFRNRMTHEPSQLIEALNAVEIFIVAPQSHHPFSLVYPFVFPNTLYLIITVTIKINPHRRRFRSPPPTNNKNNHSTTVPPKENNIKIEELWRGNSKPGIRLASYISTQQ